MKYNVIVLKILYDLGIHKRYKGVKYTLSCIDYIDKNEASFLPVTKILYVDVAKSHNTSKYNIEKGIRGVIDRIWSMDTNIELRERIFGPFNLGQRPSNTEFLITLHSYIKMNTEKMSTWNDDYVFICPKCKEKCPFYKEIFMDLIEK